MTDDRDITERLEHRAISYEESGPSAHHTAAILREAKMEIESLRADLSKRGGCATCGNPLSRNCSNCNRLWAS